MQLVVSRAVSTLVAKVETAAFSALGEGLARDGRGLTVEDGDRLHGRGGAQGDGLAVERALSRWVATIGRVANLCSLRTLNGHLS